MGEAIDEALGDEAMLTSSLMGRVASGASRQNADSRCGQRLAACAAPRG